MTYIDESKAKSIYWDIGTSYINQNIKYFNAAIKNFCEENKAEFISMDGIIDNVDIDDVLHPNTKGHKKIFDKIRPEIEILLQSNK